VHFIICEGDKDFVVRCKKIIFKIMSGSKLVYDTIEVNNWNQDNIDFLNELVGSKIYICGNVENKRGFELAKDIRKNGDWNSSIIIVTELRYFKEMCHKKLVTFNFIFKDVDVEKNLYDAINITFKVNSCCSCLCITENSEMYQISYDEILYIEKRLNENYSTIVTENGEFLVRKSIVSIYDELEHTSFYKTHRSCIVNINKIKMVDFDRNIIKFKNKQIDLISRSNKRGLREKLENK